MVRDKTYRPLVTGGEFECDIDGMKVIGRALLVVKSTVVWQVISRHAKDYGQVFIDIPFDFVIINETCRRGSRVVLPGEVEAALQRGDDEKVVQWVRHWAGR